jgi:hypothetical protein
MSSIETFAMRLAPLVLAVVPSFGCAAEVYGAATITWTIEGSSEPALCATRGVETVRIEVAHDDGTFEADDRLPCRASSARYVLRQGWYVVTLTFLDAAGAPRAGPRRTGSFHVTAGRDTFVTIDTVIAETPGGGGGI